MTMRMAGITGTFDTDAMVKAELEPYKLKITTKTQERQILELKQKQYRQVLKDTRDFYNKYISSAKSDSLMLSSNYKSVKFTSSDDNSVSATGNSSASIDNYTIHVKQLASNAKDTLADGTATAGDNQTIQIGTTTTITFKAGADGKETVTNYNKAVSDRKTYLKSLSTPSAAEQQELTDLNDIVINAQYNTIDKGVVFTAAKAGTGGFTLNSNTKAMDKCLDAEIINGNNNIYRIDSTHNTSYSNEVNIDGVNFKFKNATGAIDDGSGNLTGGSPVKLAGVQDVSDTKAKIISFIGDYNTLITKLNTKLSEKKYRDFMPLTDEQRKDMSDSQVTTWEDKVNSGLIRKDNDVQRIVSNMKTAMRTLISDSGLKLENIGIKPIDDFKEGNGTFKIDEEKLTKALENNMDGVKELFLKDSTTNGGVLFGLKSILDKEVMTSSTSKLIKKVGLEGSVTNEMSTQLDKMQTQITSMNTALTTREDSLYKKYASLESSLSAFDSQSSWLSQQFTSN